MNDIGNPPGTEISTWRAPNNTPDEGHITRFEMPIGATRFTDIDLSPGTEYFYNGVLENSADRFDYGWRSYSTAASPGLPPLGIPYITQKLHLEIGTIRFAWDQALEDADEYVFRSRIFGESN
ncbi:MAG: hypothetical protein ACI9UA_005773 [Pseudoalteromonas tetraodonis]